MKKVLLIQVLTFISIISFGQVKPLDLKEIKNIANTSSHRKLFDRFLNNDTTLTLDDYITLYYGQAFRSEYKPYANHDSIASLNTYLHTKEDSADYKKVLYYTGLILKEFPFNLDQIYINGIAYDKLGEKEISKLWFYKFDKLIKAIMSSGDGKEKESAFIVINVSDEYSLLYAFGLRLTKQSLVSNKKSHFDVMEIAKNNYGIEKLYFNIDLFFGKWE